MDPFAGTVTYPSSFHRYTYVSGDPITRVDPSGQFEGLAGISVNIGVITGIGGAVHGAIIG